MCHIRNMQKMNKFAPSLQKKIDKIQDNTICSPRNLLSTFREVAKKDRRLKIKETQKFVREKIIDLEQIMENINFHQMYKNLNYTFPDQINCSDDPLNDAFLLESYEMEHFRYMIQTCKE